MFARCWSFEGRISRGAFWLGILFVDALALGTIAMVIGFALPEAWIALLVIPFVVLIGSAMYALQVKRLHDLGQSASILWSPIHGFRWVWAMFFSAGEKGANQFGLVPPQVRTSSWLTLAIVVGGLLTATTLVFTAGMECRESVSATGSTEDEAKTSWRHEVERLYGRRFADSGITVMSVSACINGSCTASARPCALSE